LVEHDVTVNETQRKR